MNSGLEAVVSLSVGSKLLAGSPCEARLGHELQGPFDDPDGLGQDNWGANHATSRQGRLRHQVGPEGQCAQLNPLPYEPRRRVKSLLFLF